MPEAPLDLYLFTYNCNKQKFNGDQFVSRIVESFPTELASLYVFGVQELCSILDGSFPQVVARHMIKLDELFIRALTTKYGHKDVRFQTVGINHIGAIGLIAITPYPLKFTRVKSASSSCGYGFSSMKGAVGLRVLYVPEGRKSTHKSAELTFACAHLPAYEGEYYYRLRNSKLLDMIRSLDFGDGYGLLKPDSHTFFMGDLNYRTTKKFEFDSESSKRLFALQNPSRAIENIESLVKEYDELTLGRSAGDIFAGFTEDCIQFPPTYKYHINTAIYNSKRSPSWCDRILYQSTYDCEDEDPMLLRKKESKRVLSPIVRKYSSIPSLLQSDHQPVYLHITIPFTPPKPIVSPTGYLQLLPSEVPNIHLYHDEPRDAIELSALDESVAGPTQIYVKPTKLDAAIKRYISPTSDWLIGYGLWFGTTPSGRILLLLLVLVLWGASLFF